MPPQFCTDSFEINLNTEHGKEPKMVTFAEAKRFIKVAPLSPAPSSYPNLWKAPVGRDKPNQSAIQWLDGKRKTDDIGGRYWRVHDKLYDLVEFIDRHPGGRDWIAASRGTDVTEAFEVSHVVKIQEVEAILSKYYVCEATTRRNSPYTFHDNGFYKTLKRRSEPILKKVGSGPTPQILLMQDAIAAAVVILSLTAVYFHSLSLMFLAGLAIALCVNAAHNFFHVRDTWRRFYWDITMVSSYEWRISHVLSHHNFPNTILDYEVQMLEPVFNFLVTSKKNWFQRYGPYVYSHPVYAITFFNILISRMIKIWRNEQELRPENLIIFFELLLFTNMSPSVWLGIKAWLIIHSVASYWFVLIGMNAAHHHPVCFHDGDEARPDPDFGLCQLDAVREKAGKIHQSLFVILTTFGDHTLHHLFPSVCHSKLHYLEKVFEETLKEFQTESNRFLPALDFFTGALQQMVRTTPNPFTETPPKIIDTLQERNYRRFHDLGL